MLFRFGQADFCLYTTRGLAPSVRHSLVTMTSSTSSSEGIWYMTSVITPSMMVRSPLAPVFKRIAVCAISFTASSSTVSLTPSKPMSY